MPISVEGLPLEIDPRITSTTQELAEQFPFNLDYNSGDTIGFGKTVAVDDRCGCDT